MLLFGGGSDNRSMHGRGFARELPIRKFRTQFRSRATLHKFRYLHQQDFPDTRGHQFRPHVQMFNAFDHPNFALPSDVEAGVPGVSVPARFGTLESTISPPTGLLGVGLRRRQLPTHDCVSRSNRVLTQKIGLLGPSNTALRNLMEYKALSVRHLQCRPRGDYGLSRETQLWL